MRNSIPISLQILLLTNKIDFVIWKRMYKRRKTARKKVTSLNLSAIIRDMRIKIISPCNISKAYDGREAI